MGALLESMALNHPFQDGNKRVAFGVSEAFLRINGFKIGSNSEEVHLEPWLRIIVKET
jgi:death-on-curing protein